jgi:hypothetical protein
VPNITETEEGRAMLERVQRQTEFLQSREPQHVLSRYGELPKFPVKLVLPTVPSKEQK